jgi:Carbamoyltransferase C-terminus
MVLNTSFNLKNQPIVESPEDAVKSLLASEGRIAALFMGLFEVTLRPFPFSDLQTLAAESGMKTQGGAGAGAGEEGLSALLAAELGVVVRAKRFYMLEMVSSSGTGAASGAGTPLRIRIQGTDTAVLVT